ncbi:Glycosyltransferase, DXD sugar-binding region [Penicillium camemberti]|uniref:Glycosyltransferase, DXD sugar-binding region n=1 Tax=Penicillium camemberti (strain FM 013) TaxID=1429867 RepID=A0A0G4PJG8_PENC3|nr:Glycosyltransferase, DXD sugar-binding region [Penicillium camemberti]
MIIVWGKGRTRFMGVGVLVLFLIFVVHLLNFANPFSNPGELSASIDIITACATSDFENPDDSHSIPVPKIPNVVHQIWKTADLRTYSTQMKASHDQWKQEFEPLNYTIKLWTDDDIFQLIKEKYAWFLSTYEAYPQNIQRADIARLLVIHAEGGIYADLDVYPNSVAQIQCLQNLNLEAILAPTSGTLGLSNHFFMAEPESPFLLWALYEGKRRGGAASRFIPLPYLQVFWSTGPTMVTAAFRKYAWLHGTLRHTLGLLDDRYSRAVIQHKAGRSWHGSDGRALNYVGDNLTMNSLMVVVAFFSIISGVACVARRYWF